MTLDEAIVARRSIRSYDMEELEPELIDSLVDFLSDLTVPDETIDWNFDILPLDDMRRLVNGVPRLLAPHYLVIRSEKIKNCLQNAGYIGEMVVLWLTAQGIATCWQGSLEAEKDFFIQADKKIESFEMPTWKYSFKKISFASISP